jgi:hypothetical protein
MHQRRGEAEKRVRLHRFGDLDELPRMGTVHLGWLVAMRVSRRLA